jgi:hypothetical protein
MSLWEQESCAPCQWSISCGPQSGDVLWWSENGEWLLDLLLRISGKYAKYGKGGFKARTLSDCCDRGLASAALISKPGVASRTDYYSARSAHLINISTQLGDIFKV